MKRPEEIRSYAELICGVPQGRILLRRRDSETVRARRILRTALLKAGYTQSETARICGQHPSSISCLRVTDLDVIKTNELQGKHVDAIVTFVQAGKEVEQNEIMP